MPDIFISASTSCDANGGLITGTWSGVSVQDATVNILGTGTSYTDSVAFTGVSGGSFTFDTLANDLYEVSVTGTIDGQSNVLEINVNCGPPPPSCDLTITSVTALNTTGGFDNGRATINATGTGTIEYSLNGQDWQSSNIFYNLPIGVYTAYIRKFDQISCGDTESFEIAAAPVMGCMNPDATNYNPAATQDDGTCIYLSKFYACGGVLPNPVNIEVSLSPSTGGEVKNNHYVKLNLYKTGATTPFATATQTLRNGKASIDVSRFLRSQFVNTYTEPGGAVVYKDETQSFGFYIGIVEYYNGSAQAEVIKALPPRVAVNAALPEYADSIEPYLIKGTGTLTEPPLES